MKQGRVRRRASEGARKERAGPPVWADDRVMKFAQRQASFIRNSLAASCDASAYTIACVGAALVAWSLVTYHRDTCGKPDCADCASRSSVDPRPIIHDMVDFYVSCAELDVKPVEGRA